ncbi:E3 ubiquitin-protein ligase RGLG2-like isoform X1 [Primulina tabacum]|uniref:E3 ubiquitin-protein ligase RGLG2-like isoform X1 n=1 Tax=Primulina tabacum TaxID=48773 RepID=UPI003F5A08C9
MMHIISLQSDSDAYSRKEAEFALSALMEIPSQYLATIELNILGSHQAGNPPSRTVLPPPSHGRVSSSGSSFMPYGSSSFPHSTLFYSAHESPSSNMYDNKGCPICKSHSKDMAFGCGHQTCCDCGIGLVYCPICRSTITTRIKLYP